MLPIQPICFCFPVVFISCLFIYLFYPCQPSFPFPDARKVKQERCSVSPHLSCRSKTRTQLCNKKKAWMKQGRRDTDAWGWMWNEEHASASCTLPYKHTHKASCYCTPTRGSTQHTNVHGQLVRAHSTNAPNQANEWSTKVTTIECYREKEYLALPSGVQDLENRKKTRRKKTERRWKQRHTNTTVVLLLCMLCMMSKPWRSL